MQNYTPASQFGNGDPVLSDSIMGSLQSLHAQMEDTASFWTKMRVQRQMGAIAGKTAVELFKAQNAAKERAVGAMIAAKHDVVQKELLKANLAATAEVDAAIAGIFTETRARLSKIIVNDETELFKWEVTETAKVDAQVASGELSEHRAKSLRVRIVESVDSQIYDNKAVVEQILQTLRDRVAQALKPFAATR
jgi:hypothetical protein